MIILRYKMDTSKLLKIFFLLFGIIYTRAEAAPADGTSQPQQNIAQVTQNLQNSVHKLGTQFNSAVVKEIPAEGNFLFSPLNVYTALALLHLGSSGATRNELSTALGLPSDDSNLTHEIVSKMLNDIQNTSSSEVAIANGVFLQKDSKLKPSYLEESKKFYKSEVQSVDFANGGNQATDTVNKWVSSKTKERIPKLFQNEISPQTKLLLASALFFNATWSDTFSKLATTSEKFNTGLKQVDAQTMHKKSHLSYINDEALRIQAVSLPYEHNEFAFLVILPYENQTLKTLVDDLKPENYQKLIQDISSKPRTYVDCQIPRLKFKWSQSINQRIIDYGIKKIFQDAEFDNLIDGISVAVSDVTHAAEIEVNEEGTTATAVTTIQITRTMPLPDLKQPVKFYVNRSFLFSIYHPNTGISLFNGFVQNPTEAA